MELDKLLVVLPKWIFVFLAVAVSALVVHSLMYSECRTTLFGLPFGPDKSCESSPAPKQSLNYSYTARQFSDVKQSAVIPDSQGAAFCGLTGVDDDSPPASCKITYNNKSKEWEYSTGDGPGGNWCQVTCVRISLE